MTQPTGKLALLSSPRGAGSLTNTINEFGGENGYFLPGSGGRIDLLDTRLTRSSLIYCMFSSHATGQPEENSADGEIE